MMVGSFLLLYLFVGVLLLELLLTTTNMILILYQFSRKNKKGEERKI